MSKQNKKDKVISAYLKPNHLCPENGKYYAKVRGNKTLNISDICRQAIERGGSTTKLSTMEFVVREFLDEMAYQLTSGMSVNLDYMHISPCIKGNFDSLSDKFDETRHSLHYNFNEGKALRKSKEQTKVKIQGKYSNDGGINTLYDFASQQTNTTLTPGRNARINGRKIKITGDESEVGLFFINTESGERIKVPASDISVNENTTLIFLIPQLTPGKYTIEILTYYSGGGKQSKTLYTIDYPFEPLNIEAQ